MTLRSSLAAAARLVLAGAVLAGGGCAVVRTSIRPGFYPPQVPSPEEAERIAMVRVLLANGLTHVRVSSPEPVTVIDPHRRIIPIKMSLGEDAQLLSQNHGFILDRQFIVSDQIHLVPAAGTWIKVNGFRYRGELSVSLRGPKEVLMLVNYAPLEDYLKGVVPNEVEHTWPPEALKAQAVAARTFTLSRMLGQDNSPYDLDASTNSQVYRGLDSEKPAATQAVEATRHIIAVWRGKLISAFYHSNCGGHTANVKDVWGGEAAYLGGAPCGFCDDGPHAAWKYELSLAELAKVLTQHNVPVENIRAVETRGRTSDGRVQSVEIAHGQGVENLKGPAFRMLVGPDRLKSTNFEVRIQGRTVLFAGKGWGHGVGLCQEGACNMARAGYRFEEILAYYYPGIELRRLDF